MARRYVAVRKHIAGAVAVLGVAFVATQVAGAVQYPIAPPDSTRCVPAPPPATTSATSATTSSTGTSSSSATTSSTGTSGPSSTASSTGTSTSSATTSSTSTSGPSATTSSTSTSSSSGTTPPTSTSSSSASRSSEPVAGEARDPRAQPSGAALESIIEQLPCPTSGRVSFDTNDNLGEQLGVLDTTPDPQGGYFGVYQSPVYNRADTTFRVSLARSTDLIHWTRLRVLVASGASMPTLRPVPGGKGYMLAYERAISPADGDQIALRYFPTLSALLSGASTAQLNLPRRVSSYNNGTPTIIWIQWRGGLAHSLIRLGFHYETGDRTSRGPDREALGTVTGFRSWTASPDSAPDVALSRQGLTGNHGDFRQFTFADGSWRIYEGQATFGNFNTWHVLLYSVDSQRLYPLQLTTGTPVQITSVGNPTVTEQPAPNGSGEVLLVTTFVFDASAPGYGGELVYYQPA